MRGKTVPKGSACRQVALYCEITEKILNLALRLNKQGPVLPHVMKTDKPRNPVTIRPLRVYGIMQAAHEITGFRQQIITCVLFSVSGVSSLSYSLKHKRRVARDGSRSVAKTWQ